MTEGKAPKTIPWNEQSLFEKAWTIFVLAGTLALIVGTFKFCFGGACGNKDNDCWYRAYEKAYCTMLVLAGKGVGPCPMTVPGRCWDEEADYTRMGWERGVEDAKKR